MKHDYPGATAGELMRLAQDASRARRNDQAIRYLKQAQRLAPNDAAITYLLAAEHAQLGIYPRAMAELEQALRLDPGLAAARFQLGFLKLSAGEDEPALALLAPLAQRGAGDCYFHFGAGLASLVAQDFPACRRELERGLACGGAPEAIETDMRRVLQAIADRRGDGEPASQDGQFH